MESNTVSEKGEILTENNNNDKNNNKNNAEDTFETILQHINSTKVAKSRNAALDMLIPMIEAWVGVLKVQSTYDKDLIQAIDFAAEKHKNQKRKDKNSTPYINHPIRVMKLIKDYSASSLDRKVIIGALLHDVLEDTNTTDQELIDRFGRDIYNVVKECTDDKSLDKITRKKLAIKNASQCSKEAKIIKLADKLTNLSDLIDHPPSFWSLKEIHGYFCWCKALVDQIRDTDSRLEYQLDRLFEKANIQQIKNLDQELNDYYSIISHSE